MAKLHFRGNKGKAASEERPQRGGNLSTSLEKQKNMNLLGRKMGHSILGRRNIMCKNTVVGGKYIKFWSVTESRSPRVFLRRSGWRGSFLNFPGKVG